MTLAVSKTFVVTSYVDQQQLEEWFSWAAAGDQAFYATGPHGNPRHPVQKLVNKWAAAGEAIKLKPVDLAEGMKAFAFTRARPDPRGAYKRVMTDEEWRETPDGRIFLELVRAANFGLPCPTNAKLAEVAGLPDADAARYRIKLLAQQRRIDVAHDGPGKSFRRVRIVETGRWTADERKGARV